MSEYWLHISWPAWLFMKSVRRWSRSHANLWLVCSCLKVWIGNDINAMLFRFLQELRTLMMVSESLAFQALSLKISFLLYIIRVHLAFVSFPICCCFFFCYLFIRLYYSGLVYILYTGHCRKINAATQKECYFEEKLLVLDIPYKNSFFHTRSTLVW